MSVGNLVKLRYAAVLSVGLALALSAPAASAAPPGGPPICSSPGAAISGTYGNLTINGNAYVPNGATLEVFGTLAISKGACLDAFTLGTVHVGGNILVGQGSVLALGCTVGSLGPESFLPCEGQNTDDTVGGSILAHKPLTMYLDGDTIHGGVVSIGGGPGPTLSPYINFPIKENHIGGGLIVDGWEGAWFGVLRNTVQGNVLLINNVGVTISPETHEPDSSEIATNEIAGNLICFSNTPAPQLGDSGGLPNLVGGHKIGQCTKV